MAASWWLTLSRRGTLTSSRPTPDRKTARSSSSVAIMAWGVRNVAHAIAVSRSNASRAPLPDPFRVATMSIPPSPLTTPLPPVDELFVSDAAFRHPFRRLEVQGVLGFVQRRLAHGLTPHGHPGRMHRLPVARDQRVPPGQRPPFMQPTI